MNPAAIPFRQVDVHAIEHELNALWKDMGEDSGAVTRAVMSNLIIWCDACDAMQLSERIGNLSRMHPARVLVISPGSGDDDGLSARVRAHCQAVSDGTHICAEHVEVHCPTQRIPAAVSVIRALLLGDLPVALWWCSSTPPALVREVFDPLSDLADQVIYDSVGWSDPSGGVSAMSRWVSGRDTVAFNLAWRRLKPWRRMIAQTLDPARVPTALGTLHTLEFQHGPHALPMVWLLVGWLAARLNWRIEKGSREAGKSLSWTFLTPERELSVTVHRQPEGPARIDALAASWRDGDVHIVDDGAHLRVDAANSSLPCSSLPMRDLPLEQMIAAQLAHREADLLFLEALTIAEAMARALPGSS
ncbi:MAG: glucose-6-phosphate dehydrogenase assembly protein OpcA [Gammaproteobacteria bacterium]